MPKSSNRTYTLREVPYTKRDIEVIYAIFTARYMTTPQIWYLYFKDTKPYKVCQDRLRKLKGYGLLRCIAQAFKRGETTPPNLWAVDKLGGELLVHERGVDPELVDTTPWMHEDNNHKILHHINTTTIHIALIHAAPTVGMTVSRWEDERELRSQQDLYAITVPNAEGKEVPISFAPDAFFVLTREGKQGNFWVEMDQATIDLEPSSYQKRSIIGKIRTILNWAKSERYKKEFENRPLRYLMITTGSRRMHNMLSVAHKVFKEEVGYRDDLPEEEKLQKLAEVAKLGKKIPFTTLSDVTEHNVLTSPIWHIVGSKDPHALLDI